MTIHAQRGIAFQHLNTGNGLSYLGVNDMCTDKKGNLWIATGNGLNKFNGKTVDKYFASEYPQLQNNNIIHVTCDSSDRIWVLTNGGYVTMLDEKRQLHRAGLYTGKGWVRVFWILNAQHGNIILWTNQGHFQFNSTARFSDADSLSVNDFSSIPISRFDTIKSKGYRQVFHYDDDSYLFVNDQGFYKVNYKTGKLEHEVRISSCRALIKWGTDALLYTDGNTNELKVVNIFSGRIQNPFKGYKDQFGKEVKAFFLYAEKISVHEYLFTTFNAGLYIYDEESDRFYHYMHSVADPSSIADNTQTTLTVGKKGWVFITCNPNGISYFNINNFIGNQNVFTDNKGKAFDGYIAGIATKDNNSYYIGTSEGMLEWKRNTNSSNFINFTTANGEDLIKKNEVPSIIFDNKDRIWVALLNDGILVLDKNKKLLRQLKNKPGDRNSLKLTRVSFLVRAPDGYIWASGLNGICKINPETFEIENFYFTPLAKLDEDFSGALLFSDSSDLWVATGNSGVYHYNIQTNKLNILDKNNGLISNEIFCLNNDRVGNIYIGTRSGLNILYTNGRIKTITQKDGLLIDRVEGLLSDKQNRMWIGNDIGLVCYNPADSSLKTFDERYGLSIYGFRVGSYFKTPNGEFIFGTPKGVQYFYPDSLYNKKINLSAYITKIETKNISSTIAETTDFTLSPSENQVTFYFGTVDYTPHLRTYYQYKLEGADKNWINIADQNSVRYNSLLPGKYTFKIRISNDNKNWQEGENEVSIFITTSFYKTWWFKLLIALVCCSVIFFVLNYYRKQQLEKRNRLETELVITYFASQINSHTNTEALLWDIAKNCISKLHFEDCVIYLLDEKANTLIQKAAYGPKSPDDLTIHQPIEIPVGKGITGTVAKSGIPEIINNTAEDPRYILDDAKRLSEITVPILINNKVIGVIDSEHRQKNFFTPTHLTILQTIAALCANQIQKTKAEEEKQNATIELWENKQKAVESRLQSLRLQMNPHFLFNALNSIQQMILANEEIVATKYLSRFSKLLRTILVHSDKEMITLKEEVEIINMYVELESVRFKDSFTYSIECDEKIESEEIKIPTLLIQPFVENAIWHGLMHKEGNRKLAIRFTEEKDMLACIIEDNGIGRKKAQEINSVSGQDKKHTGKGIAVSEERLKTLKNSRGMTGSISITDLTNVSGENCGTQVIIYFPI